MAASTTTGLASASTSPHSLKATTSASRLKKSTDTLRIKRARAKTFRLLRREIQRSRRELRRKQELYQALVHLLRPEQTVRLKSFSSTVKKWLFDSCRFFYLTMPFL